MNARRATERTPPERERSSARQRALATQADSCVALYIQYGYLQTISDWPNTGRRHNLPVFIAMFFIVILIKRRDKPQETTISEKTMLASTQCCSITNIPV